MTLTGTPLLVTLIIIAVLMPAALVLAWPRVRGNRWLVVSQRVGLVLVAQLSALLLAGVALNDYGEFFSSWSQAAGAFFASTPHTALGNQQLGDLNSYGASRVPIPATGAVVRVRASDTLPAGLTATRWSTPAQYATRGAVATLSLYGPSSQLSNRVALYLPPAYFAGYRSLPLIEAITGYPSTYRAWVDKLTLPGQLLAGIRAHVMGQLVVVMTPVGLPYPLDSECTDAPGGPFAYTYFAKDVPQVTTRLLGLHPAATAALGYSTGGYCAVKLAMVDPGVFAAAASMSGYFYAQPGKYSPNMFAGSTQVRHVNDLVWRLQNLPVPRTSVLVMTGTEEAGADGWVNNNKFLATVRAPMRAERFIVPVDFGHSYRTWTQEVSPALIWISRRLGAVGGQGGIGSALFSRQGLQRHHHRHRHPRPAVGSPAPTPSTSPSPTRSSASRSPSAHPLPTPPA